MKGAAHLLRLPKNQFVFRSDVKSYYASIDHAVLLALGRDRVDDVICVEPSLWPAPPCDRIGAHPSRGAREGWGARQSVCYFLVADKTR